MIQVIIARCVVGLAPVPPSRRSAAAGRYATSGAAPNGGPILSESSPGPQASRRASENAIPGLRRDPLRASTTGRARP